MRRASAGTWVFSLAMVAPSYRNSARNLLHYLAVRQRDIRPLQLDLHSLGYAVLGYDSLLRGLDKLEINHEALAADLDAAWEVLAEPIQTVMRLEGMAPAHTDGTSVQPRARASRTKPAMARLPPPICSSTSVIHSA